MKIFGKSDKPDDYINIFKFDPIIGCWGIPNLSKKVHFPQTDRESVTIQHNSEGDRDRQFQQSEFRESILCFGGSHTYGSGMEYGERFTDLLSQKTEQTVVNLGKIGLGLDQICLSILEKSEYFSPSIIVVEQHPWAMHRIIATNNTHGYVKPYFYMNSQGDLKLRKVPSITRYKWFKKIIFSFRDFRKEFMEFKAGIDLNDYNPDYDPLFLYWKINYYDYLYKVADKILYIINDFCCSRNIKLLFTLGVAQQKICSKQISDLIDYDLPHKRLKELLDKNKIRYVDMSPYMLAENEEEEPVIFQDGHLNAKGHAIHAHVLYQTMESLGWLKT